MYDPEKAGNYWGKRLGTAHNRFNAVLSYNLPHSINLSYDRWERSTILNTISNEKDVKVIADIGSGWGRLSIPLAELGYKVYAIDLSKKMLDTLKKLSGNASKNITCHNIGCTNISFLQNIDAVIMAGVLEHLPNHIKLETIRDIHDILSENGIALFVLNNNKSKFLKQEDKYKMKDQDKSGYFLSLMDYKEMIDSMENIGFEVSIIGSNYHYSLGRHLFLKNINGHGTELSEFFDNCSQLDLTYKLINDDIVDQYIVLCRKKKVKHDPIL